MRITKSVVFDVNKCGGRFYVGWDNFDLLTWLCSGHYNGRSSPKRQAGHPWVFMSLHVLCSRAPEQWAVKTAPFLSPSNHDFTHLFFIAFELFLPKPLHNLNINQTRTWSWDQVLMKVVIILILAPSAPTHPYTWNIPHQQLLPEYLSCVVQGRIFFSLGHLRI